jgi:predicted membrane protein
METLNSDKPAPDSITKIMKVVVALIVVGVVLWLVNTYIPMAGSIRAILNIVVVVATCVLVLQAVGLWSAVVRLWSDLSHRISR